MTQAELDAAYDQAAYAANLHQIVSRWGVLSEDIRARLGPPTRHAYGPGANETGRVSRHPPQRADQSIRSGGAARAQSP